MLRSFTLLCEGEGVPARMEWAAYLHGCVMESLSPDHALAAHSAGLRPFSQHVLPEGNGFQWKFSCWDDPLADAFAQVFTVGKAIRLKQRGVEVRIRERTEDAVAEKDFFTRAFLAQDVPRLIDVRLLTPCTHKQQNAYALFPSAELLINNLYRRFCTFTSSLSIDDEDAKTALADSVRIHSYSLRSAAYYVEGNRIAGFIGRMTLEMHKSVHLARLGGMVLSFAPYAGIGIKTALGMGACEVGANPRNSGAQKAPNQTGSHPK